MATAIHHDNAAPQDETSHPTPGQMHSGTQGYVQDMHDQQQRGFPEQGYNEQSGNGIYDGQQSKMGNTNYAQGAQQMNGDRNGTYAQGAQKMEGQGAQGDDRDTITKCNDNPSDYEKEKPRTIPSLNTSSLQSREMPLRALACY